MSQLLGATPTTIETFWEAGVDWFLKVFHRLSMPLDPSLLSEAARARLIQEIARTQDRSAFIALFAFYAPRIVAQARRFGLDASAAEDVAQDAMLSVWQRAGQFDSERGSASAWVFTIATNIRIDRARRERRIAAAGRNDLEAALMTSAATDAAPDADQLTGLVRALPPDQRLIIELSFYSDVTHGEIAAQLGVPLGTVKSRIRLAMEKLRHALRSAS